MSSTPRRAAAPGRLVVLGGEGVRAPGRVWLVGAGPGDPELLTLKALKVLQSADVLVHDGLVPAEILDLAESRARRIDVAKRKSRHTLPQDGINRLLVALAREGLNVVRLKGGDPFVFGRGGEELDYCRAEGIEVQVVPGLTAALASGISLTHRGVAQSLTLVTGHAAHGEPDLDWAALARPGQTVAVYMGLSTAGAVGARLIEAGRALWTPVAVVENASRSNERRVVTTLGELGAAVEGWSGPAILVIGEAVLVSSSVREAQTGEVAGCDSRLTEGASADSAGPLSHGASHRATSPARRFADKVEDRKIRNGNP